MENENIKLARIFPRWEKDELKIGDLDIFRM